MAKGKYLISALFIIVLLTILYFTFAVKKPYKIAYINIEKVFNEFTYTRKLKQEYKLNTETRKLKIDSVAYLISLLERKINTDPDKSLISEYNYRKNKYYELTKEYQETNEDLSSKYDNRIIGQMNSYLKEFSREEGIDILLSSDDVGSVVYVEKELDQTDKAIEYINKKFNSKGK